MINKIDKEQYEELCESKFWDSDEDFHKVLEEITGITARRYVGYSYFDSSGNFIGDSNDNTVRELLNNAYIEIVDRIYDRCIEDMVKEDEKHLKR